MQSSYQSKINTALKDLSTTNSFSSALLICNTLLEYMGVETKNVEDIELSKLKLPNAERYDRWFDAHPHFRGDRACFDLALKESLIEAKFFAIQKRSKLFIAGAVSFTPNFEDRDYTRNDPNMKIGIDFFFPPEKNSVIVVLSNKGNLRLVELGTKLTNTQIEIFNIWEGVVNRTTDKNVLHTTIWESFKLSSLNKKFYEGISNSFISLTQHLKNNNVEEQLANQFANRLHGRLLFLWFLRKKNIVNDTKEYFVINNQEDTDYYREKLEYLFFNVLNTDIPERDSFQKTKETLFGIEKGDPTLFIADSVTPYLNGGLFDPKADGEYWNSNKPTFPKGFFKTLYEHFDSFNFTTDESTPEYEQIAIDPEMLGRIFESFLATLTTETGAQAKKANGAFYTPREIVSYMSRESLRQYLCTTLEADTTLKTSIDDLLDLPDRDWALAGTNSKRDAVSKEDRERIMEALRKIKVLDPAVGSGAFPMGVLHKILNLFERLQPNFDSYETKLSVLRNNIYGVDIDPTAIEISRLRAWLSIIVDVKDIKKIKPLPNLDFKFVCANSLIGLEKSAASFSTDENLKPELIRIRDDYYATSSKTKKERLQKDYTKLTHRGSLFDTEETTQLKSYQPFENGKIATFYDSELMHGIETFDVVIGNPPYSSKQSVEMKRYKAFYKYIEYKCDPYAFFIELSLRLVKQNGLVSFIVPVTWMTNVYYQKLRHHLVESKSLQSVVLIKGLAFETANVDTGLLFLQNKGVKDESYNWTTTDPKVSVLQFTKRTYDSVRKESRYDIVPEINPVWDAIRSKLETDSRRLGSFTKISLGMKLAGNDNFIVPVRDAEHQDSIIFGSDISLYGRLVPERFFSFSGSKIIGGTKNPIIQRTKNKILVQAIRNLSLKRRIVATLDSEGFFFVGTVNSIIPQESGWDIYYLLGLINSTLLNTYFSRRFTTISLTSAFLGEIPIKIPNVNEPLSKEIRTLTVQLLAEKDKIPEKDAEALRKNIDNLVYKLYGLDEEEIKLISNL